MLVKLLWFEWRREGYLYLMWKEMYERFNSIKIKFSWNILKMQLVKWKKTLIMYK